MSQQRRDKTMMQCEDCMALLTDHLEGTLAEQQRLILEEHLRICPDCGPYHLNLLKAIDLSRTVGDAAAECRPLPVTNALIGAILKARRDTQG